MRHVHPLMILKNVCHVLMKMKHDDVKTDAGVAEMAETTNLAQLYQQRLLNSFHHDLSLQLLMH